MSNLGKLLKRHRAIEAATLEGMAAKIGINRSVLARIEKGKSVEMASLGRVLIWLSGDRDMDIPYNNVNSSIDLPEDKENLYPGGKKGTPFTEDAEA